ncbi:MAG: glutamine-hydrolyzing GMP synthase [Flavobacteriales bacterium]|nr:glutamine-hydrolyzing GMP synthase [Flavobacteriales bacterium]
MHQSILILDFGSQVTQLIARRIRELNIYCEIHPWNKAPEITPSVKGVILSGSPFSVHDANAPLPDVALYARVPLLGICYGAQLIAHTQGGEVVRSTHREYGRANLVSLKTESALLQKMNVGSQVWMSHGDTIKTAGPDAEIICSTSDVLCAGYQLRGKKIFAVQFHPEVYHTTEGKQLLENFAVLICGCAQDWTPTSFVDETVINLQSQLQNDRVIMGLSGGVDSSVAAELIHRAVGKNLHCIFVDNGLLRKNEFEDVLDNYRDMGLQVTGVDAKQQFYSALKGLTDPEEKRKAIGRAFIEVFDAESKKENDAKWLGQGTIYPDVIESLSATGGPSQTIKSHHNVGGLPDFMKLKVVEPLRLLFKDEVRRVGKTLGIKDSILSRHPFPGPGLGIRIIGAITPEKVRILQEVDAIWINSLRENNLYNEVWQAGAILLPVQSVGVMGDERTYEQVVALRAVNSTDGMTADWSRLPHEFLAKVSSDIINKVKGVNRVVYDISSKPPATIEWE